MKHLLIPFACLATLVATAQDISSPNIGSDVRYATDAFPGFDPEKDSISPSRKEPKWFSWINGPNRETPAEQFAYCQQLEAEENWSKAVKHYDALVREWPTSPEAPKAQLRLADILEGRLQDFEEASSAYRYLLDFYSLRCDYNAVANKLYELAGLMRQEGKTIVFFRFRNTVDVRRAFEAAVLRAPGATWAPQAMLTIADLREEEGKDGEAVKVYENLRNIHYGSPEAREAVVREALVRLRILREHGYNRERCLDTISFLDLALKACDTKDLATLQAAKDEAKGVLEDEAYRATRFYDSSMRTRRSAITAYERFLADYPDSVHAEEMRARLAELKEGAK